jgi:lipopolysaccharide export system protein LptC
MSDAAGRERAVKQRWAIPGSTHDRIVRWTKVALPMAAGVLIAILAVAPLGKHGDVSFILDKKKVQSSPERMRIEQPRYTGSDDKGQKFEVKAQHAVQRSSSAPIVDIDGIFAQLALAEGPLMIAANQGRYDLDTQKVAINGPIKVVGPDGYRLETENVLVDFKHRQMTSGGPVAGQMRLGQFQAGQLQADLGERKVVLAGGARLKIVQGAVR